MQMRVEAKKGAALAVFRQCTRGNVKPGLMLRVMTSKQRDALSDARCTIQVPQHPRTLRQHVVASYVKTRGHKTRLGNRRSHGNRQWRMDLVREDLSTICLHRILADNHKHAASSDSAGGAARALHAASRAVQNREKMGEFRATSRQPTLPPVLGVS
jgi:hypothetical protein